MNKQRHRGEARGNGDDEEKLKDSIYHELMP
jgi:hypothetical protein